MQQIERNNLVKLGKRIKALRIKKSSSLNRFVNTHGGITTATWSRIENGKFDAKFSTLIKVAALLEMKIDELLKNLNFDYSILDD